MRTLEILEREHDWIGRMAACLEKLFSESRSTGELAEPAAELLFLYESFADGRHQDKEEGVLFPALLTGAGEEDHATLERLLLDHGEERRHLALMRESLRAAVGGDPASARELARAASEYTERHRAHSSREKELLVPMVERLMSDEMDEYVAAAFETLEGGPGDPHGLEEQIQGLCRRVGVSVPPAA